MTELSSNAIIYALIALNGEISLQHDYLESGEVPANERADEEDTLADLEQAFMEFVEVYKGLRQKEPQLPALEDLIG